MRSNEKKARPTSLYRHRATGDQHLYGPQRGGRRAVRLPGARRPCGVGGIGLVERSRRHVDGHSELPPGTDRADGFAHATRPCLDRPKQQRDRFEIQRQSPGGAWTPLATAAANATGYSNSGLTPLRTYIYRVGALNTLGPSAYWSNDAWATSALRPPLRAPWPCRP